MLPLAETLVRIRSVYDPTGMRQADRELNSYIARAGQASSLLASRFRDAGLVAALSVAAVGKAFGDVEKAETSLRRVTNLQAESFSRLNAEVKRLAPTLGLTEQKALSLATVAKRLGISDSELPKFLTTIAQAANALDIDALTVANSLAKLRASLGLSVDDLSRLTSAIVVLDNASAAAFPEILSSMERAAGLAKLIGVSGQALAAFSATLLESGVSAERSGTGLQRLFSALINRRTAISNVAGFDVSSLPPAEAVLRISEVFATLVKTGGDTRGFLKAFGGDGQRVIEVLSKLGGNAARVRELMGQSNEEFQNGGALARIFAAMTGTLAFRFEQVKSAVLAAAAAIGRTLAPFLHAILSFVEAIARAVERSPLLQYIVAFALVGTVIAAAAGFLVFFAASQTIAFMVARRGLPEIAAMWRGVGSSIKEASVAMAAFDARATVSSAIGGLRAARYTGNTAMVASSAAVLNDLYNMATPGNRLGSIRGGRRNVLGAFREKAEAAWLAAVVQQEAFRRGRGLKDLRAAMKGPLGAREGLAMEALFGNPVARVGLGGLGGLTRLSGVLATLRSLLVTFGPIGLILTVVAAAFKAISENTFGARDALVQMVKPLTDAFSESGSAGKGLKALVGLLGSLLGLLAKIAALLIYTFAVVLRPVFELLAAIANVIGYVVDGAATLLGIRSDQGVTGSLPSVAMPKPTGLTSVETKGLNIGGGGTIININNPSVRSSDDLRAMEDLVERAVRKAQRGMAAQAVST